MDKIAGVFDMGGSILKGDDGGQVAPRLLHQSPPIMEVAAGTPPGIREH